MRHTVKPIIRDDKPVKQNGKYPIYYTVRFNNLQVKCPSGLEIEKIFWNDKLGRVKSDYLNSREMNLLLEQKITELSSFIVQREIHKQPLNREVVKSFFRGEQNTDSFYAFFQKQIELWKGRKKIGTLDNYKFTLQVMKQFRSSVRFEEITLQFIEEFNNYLLFKRGNSVGGTFGRHKCLKAVINASITKGLLKENPYKSFRITNPPKRLIFLEVDELKKIENLEIPELFTGQNKTKDFFLFSCYTGIRFSDMRFLTKGNLKGNFLQFTMQKTNKAISLPLINKAIKIIEKYEHHPEKQGELLFPMSNNKRTNINLKEIVKRLKLDKNISFHTARHTFASTHVALGTHLILIKELMGHSSIEQTEIYAKPNLKQVQICMEQFDLI